MPSIHFRPEADQDLDDAYAWYEEKRRGLGQEFFQQLERALDLIQQYPEMHPKIHDDLRRGLIHRFSHQIIYEATDQLITIYAVFHASRNPAGWKKRRR